NYLHDTVGRLWGPSRAGLLDGLDWMVGDVQSR
uniref:Fibrinolytic enzyme (Fragments) n=1 Tax=Hediste japonica TaxID=73376 RepID=FIBR_HEDJA|nr:RecName: Full=Fibrinolytic enzyme; Short=NJF [Hediste japonica]